MSTKTGKQKNIIIKGFPSEIKKDGFCVDKRQLGILSLIKRKGSITAKKVNGKVIII